MSDKTSVGVSLSRDILQRIDAERGDIPRSPFLERLLEQAYAQKDEVTHTATNEVGASAGHD